MVKKLKLTNFRNFRKKEIAFSPEIAVIVGPNASGKTNILESLFLLATGKSFRARVEEEMIGYGKSIASITGITSSTRLEVKITRGENGWPRKKLLVNGVSKRLIDFAGNFRVVLFGPWDLDLVTSSPSLRRNFLDTVLAQVDREYRRAILSYEKGLRQRNKLLLRIRDEGLPRSQLLFWNQLLIRNGDYISQQRGKFIEFANAGNFQFPCLAGRQAGSSFQLEYDKSAISEVRLEQYAEEEVAAATTLVGPHRDDMFFKILNPKSQILNLTAFGSRSEQRMGVLWLKLAELAFIEVKSGEKPTLLLDDILSELDHEHRKIVFGIIKKGGQVIMTTADEHFLKEIKTFDIVKL